MKHCPKCNRVLGQTKSCPEHKISESMFQITVMWESPNRFVDPAMA